MLLELLDELPLPLPFPLPLLELEEDEDELELEDDEELLELLLEDELEEEPGFPPPPLGAPSNGCTPSPIATQTVKSENKVRFFIILRVKG